MLAKPKKPEYLKSLFFKVKRFKERQDNITINGRYVSAVA